MRYRIELIRGYDSVSRWSANVGFRYSKNGLEKLNYSEEDFTILENIVQASGTYSDLGHFTSGRRPKAMIRFDDESPLSDDFARILSRALTMLIQTTTPAIDDV